MQSETDPSLSDPAKRTPLRLRRIMFGLYIAFIVYMTIPALLWSPIYPSLILFPGKFSKAGYESAIENSKVRPEEQSFVNADGSNLHGWLFRRPEAKKIILVHHGNAGNMSTRISLANALTDGGASVFMYDYSGYGKSEGKPTLDGILQDGVAAKDYLERRLGYRPNQIIHYGESIGSGVACHAASSSANGGLILQSPVGSLPRVGRNAIVVLKPYPDFLFPQPQMQNIETIKSVSCPVLIIHGLKDRVVSPQDSEAIFQNANQQKKLVLLKQSGHNSVIGDDAIVFDQAICEFVTGRPN